jgi:methylphosphotriester-DNA--protein-cysteine methyltransferase
MFTLKRKDRFHTDDFPITVEQREPQEHFELEAHDCYEIVICPNGALYAPFQAATGTTPIAYLGKLRLARAAAMLRHHEESVTSVAYKVGYNDSNYFARRFHAMFRFPPSEYRKRQELV